MSNGKGTINTNMGRKRQKEWERDFNWDEIKSPIYAKLDLVSDLWLCDCCLDAQWNSFSSLKWQKIPVIHLVLICSRHLWFLGLFQFIFLKEGVKQSSEYGRVTIKPKAILTVGSCSLSFCMGYTSSWSNCLSMGWNAKILHFLFLSYSSQHKISKSPTSYFPTFWSQTHKHDYGDYWIGFFSEWLWWGFHSWKELVYSRKPQLAPAMCHSEAFAPFFQSRLWYTQRSLHRKNL